MNSSNSFNICPHCGNSNSLNARFCARCGTQLKVPEEVVVCRTCGTRNSPMANFCRNCGSQLKVGEQTKICPKCRKEVSVNENTCTCGYSFATISTVSPNKGGKAVDVRSGEDMEGKKGKKTKVAKNTLTSNKGGRAFAIVALVFLLLFAYFCVAPANLRPDFLKNLDKGFVTDANGTTYMYDYVVNNVNAIVSALQNPTGNGVLADVLNVFGGNVGAIILAVLVVMFALSLVFHLLVVIIRIFTGRRSKRANGFYLVLAVISTLATALVFVVTAFLPADALGGFLNFARMPSGTTLGWVVLAIPLYYWFFYLYSLIAKAKTITEQTV